jgi:hypothetical protein
VSRRQFDEDGYPCDSTPIDSDHYEAWFYTQKEGILVCADGCKNCGRQRPSLTLPWRAIKRALVDHEKAKERKP